MRSLTINIFERLFLFGWFGYDLDTFGIEKSDVFTVSVEHFYGKHEMFTLVRITNIERFGGTIVLNRQWSKGARKEGRKNQYEINR